MSIAQQAYLLLVVCGFLAFGVTLASVAWWSNRAPRQAPPAKAHGPVEASDALPIHRKAA